MGVFRQTLPANLAVRVLGKSKNRIAWTLKNDSDHDVYWGMNPATATSGFHGGLKVASGGDSFMEEHYKGDVFVITATSCEITLEDVVKGIDTD